MKTQKFQCIESNSHGSFDQFFKRYVLSKNVRILIVMVLTGTFIFGFNEFGYANGPGAAWTVNIPISLSPVTPAANFQVKISLNAGQYANMKSDGSDLRFYDNANNNCQYWIETFNNAGASTIWVKVPVAGTSALTMYYGNAAASAVSNGSTTFDYFDDFTGPLTNWTTSGPVTQSGSVVTLTDATGPTAATLTNTAPFTTASASFFLETKHKEAGYNRIRYYASNVSGGGSPFAFDYGYFSQPAGTQTTANVFYNGAFSGNLMANNTDYLTRWQITDGSTYNWSTLDFATGATIDARTATFASTVRFISILVTEVAATSTIVDWVRVRQSTATEPVATVYISPFIMNASGTFKAPDNVLSVTVQAWGGGGGGAGNNSTNISGSGGGGGAYTTLVVPVNPGTTYFIGVGAPGTAGTFASTAGGAGGSSWFNSTNSPSGALVLAVGGNGGISSATNTGGTGGAAGSCTPTAGAFSGGRGGGNLSSTSDRGGGTGGSSAGTAATGTNGTQANAPTAGAIAPTGGGNGGSSGFQTTSPSFGFPPGGGGGGSANRQVQNGAAGGTGQVKLTWAICAQPIATASSQSNISCFGLNDGSITVAASGGTSPYTFSVDGTTFLAPTPANSTTRLFTGLIPNNPYRVKVKDSKGCISK